MKKINFFIWFCLGILLAGLSGCHTNNLIDTNVEMPHRNWSYVDKISAVVDIKDNSKAFNLKFKLRHTADYRYSNIYILFHMSGGSKPLISSRHEYKLAYPDGQWLGKGSGDLYTYALPLLTNYRFPVPGKYTIEIEQNMRDNPLTGISDAGITVSAISEK